MPNTKTLSPGATVAPAVSSVRNYPSALCRKQKSKNGRNTFYSISFMFKDAWSTFILNDEDLSPSKRSDGTIIENRNDLNLGEPDDVRFVSMKTGPDTFERKALFNSTIASAIADGHKAWLRSIAV